MLRIATSEAGETLDMVCWRVIGTTATVDAVYEANPGLAGLGPVLPAGTAIVFPEAATPSRSAPLRETINLWS